MLCYAVMLTAITSCVVTESIFFNEDMSGEYMLTYDLSEMDKATKDMDSEGADFNVPKKKQDTTVVFNDLLEQYKDSIATLPQEEQDKLEKLRGLTMRMQEDEAIGLFKFSISRTFESVEALEQINEQVEEAMNVAMTFDNKGSSAEEMKGSSEANTKAMYTFTNNVFKRIQPESEKAMEDESDDMEMEDENMDDNEFAEDINQGFDEMTKDAFYVINYTFPKKIKSISNKNAVISEDGKGFTLKIPWDELTKNEALLNLEIELED